METYAPWVNKVYLMTDGQVPPWLNLDAEKLVHVRHEQIIPEYFFQDGQPVDMRVDIQISPQDGRFGANLFMNMSEINRFFTKNPEGVREAYRAAFEQKLPQKSSFEL